jgi:hypothetical protein
MSKVPLSERSLAEQAAIADPDEFEAFWEEAEAEGWPDTAWNRALKEGRRLREAMLRGGS